MKSLALAASVFAVFALPSCQEMEVSEPIAHTLSKESVEEKLVSLLGTGLPKGATEISGSDESSPFARFDCGFFCTEAALDGFVAASPVLSKAAKAIGDTPRKPGSPYLLTSWNTEDSSDTQIVKVTVSSISETELRVDVSTLRIEGLKLQ